MEKRRLGRTGHQSTVVTFGAYSVGYLDQDEADQGIQMVLDHGVNHIDIAPTYAAVDGAGSALDAGAQGQHVPGVEDPVPHP